MRQVEIYTINMWVFGIDNMKGNTQATANINQLDKVLKTVIRLEDLLNNNGG